MLKITSPRTIVTLIGNQYLHKSLIIFNRPLIVLISKRGQTSCLQIYKHIWRRRRSDNSLSSLYEKQKFQRNTNFLHMQHKTLTEWECLPLNNNRKQIKKSTTDFNYRQVCLGWEAKRKLLSARFKSKSTSASKWSSIS